MDFCLLSAVGALKSLLNWANSSWGTYFANQIQGTHFPETSSVVKTNGQAPMAGNVKAGFIHCDSEKDCREDFVTAYETQKVPFHVGFTLSMNIRSWRWMSFYPLFYGYPVRTFKV